MWPDSQVSLQQTSSDKRQMTEVNTQVYGVPTLTASSLINICDDFYPIDNELLL
mgnify:CR=1 FL=1